MRIAGIYPQKLKVDQKIQHAVSEPYGLEMILATGAKEGHDTDLFIPAKQENGTVVPISEEELIENIVEYKPDVAAFSLYTAAYPAGKRIASKLKQKLPNIKTIAGNRYPTHLKEKIEEPFDFFVIKEGEETFKEWLRETQQGQHYEKVKGLVFKKDGKQIFTGVRQRNFNLDSLPNALRFPIILNQTYQGISIPPLSTSPNYAIVESSRCCYNNCKFCDNEGFWGNRVAFRSPARVVEEMFELKEKGADIFYFMDLNMTAFPNKTLELCNEMNKQNLNASWYCMSNTSTLDGRQDVLQAMKESGCYRIAWGVESTSDSALEVMNKKVNNKLATNNQTTRVLQSALDTGILNQGYYIIGFPWETQKSIVEDSKNLKNMPLHQINIGIFTPIPMSRFYQEMMDTGYTLDPNLENHDRNHLVYNHPTLTNKSIKNLQQEIYQGFYSCPQYAQRVKTTCEIEPKFVQSFKDYTQKTLGKNININQPAMVA
ncbi:B12-binding domain-containing radical SAM protein [Candidatus Pacearchaeota archaeon]|nr:B12-binding domain-containing radical SAM protein [Candidatus Pacearchaeota archaeon]